MVANFRVVIAGGGTAGWLTACYLAKSLGPQALGGPAITVIEAPDIGIIGVGEGTFPTIRTTLQTLKIDEARFLRESSATFKQGIRFDDWARAPQDGQHTHYLHPFEFPHRVNGAELLPHWLLGEAGAGSSLADSVTIQKRIADASLAPKRSQDANFAGPLNYAYHFDAFRFAALLAAVAKESGVRHIADTIESVALDESGAISGLTTRDSGRLEADLYIDCTGFRAKLIGETLRIPFKSCRDSLLTDRAVAFQIPNEHPDTPIASYTIATGHEAGWTWDIGLNNRRGIGYVYSSAHSSDTRAEQILRAHVGASGTHAQARFLKFEAGFREQAWVRNCVAVGLSAGFFEPLESTGIMLIEVAAAMIAEFFPWSRAYDSSARLFNNLMTHRYKKIVNFLKLHYCLGERQEEFWRDNRRTETIPEELQNFLAAWRERPPCRFDFVADHETFPYCSYQYVLYGMGFRTDLKAARARYSPSSAAARQAFARLRGLAEQACADLPSHRALIDQLYREGFQTQPSVRPGSSAGRNSANAPI